MIKIAVVGSSPVLERATTELEIEGALEFVCHAKYEWKDNDYHSADRLYISLKKTLTKGLKGSFDDVDFSYLSVDLLNDLSWAENTVYSMMGRIDSLKQYTYEKRKLLYHYLLCYWMQTIEVYKLDAVVFESAPHEISDYVFFLLCKRAQIRVLIFNYTRLPLISFTSDSPGGAIVQVLQRKHNGSSDLLNKIREHLSKLKMPYEEAMPSDIKSFLSSRDYVENSKKDIVLKITKSLIGLINKVKIIFLLLHRFNLDDLRDLLANMNNSKEWRAVKNSYTINSSNFEKPHKFVYFLLNFQPENTTCPLGDRYVDQYIAISMIARYLPKEYSIVVKEHPAQLHDFSHYNYLGRDRYYYERLARIPNLLFAPTNAAHYDLLDSSLCVASVNGSVGWEAVVRKKPALVFGNAWYQTAPGVFKIDSNSDCFSAISRIVNGVKIADEEIEEFAINAFMSGIEVCLTTDDTKIHGVDFNVSENVPTAKTAMRSWLLLDNLHASNREF